VLAEGLVARNEFRAVLVLAHYNFVRGLVNASDPITFKSRRNPALFLLLPVEATDEHRFAQIRRWCEANRIYATVENFSSKEI
jgi:hypothetical protein